MPHAGLRAGYVDNPFFDPQDLAGAPRLGIPSTNGDSAQIDVSGGVRLAWRATPSGRAEFGLFGRRSSWQGAAQTAGWDAGLSAAWHQSLGDGVEARVEFFGSAAAIDLFPADDLTWTEIRLGGRWRVGDHTLDGQLGYGHRRLADRVINFETGETGQQDDLLRARLGARLRPGAGLTLEPAYAMDLTRPAAGGVEYDTHTLSVHGFRRISGFGAGVTVAGWLRDFPAWGPDGAARLDRGLAIDLRIARSLLRGLEVAGRYRYVSSTSDEQWGRYAQVFAGLELFAWYQPKPRSIPTTVAGAGPYPTPSGWVFRHRAAGARNVALVGDFNEWSPTQHPLAGPDADGWWTVTVSLEAGRQSYMFVVDGERFVRPVDAPAYQADGFGGEVGILYVLPPGEARASR